MYIDFSAFCIRRYLYKEYVLYFDVKTFSLTSFQFRDKNFTWVSFAKQIFNFWDKILSLNPFFPVNRDYLRWKSISFDSNIASIPPKIPQRWISENRHNIAPSHPYPGRYWWLLLTDAAINRTFLIAPLPRCFNGNSVSPGT